MNRQDVATLLQDLAGYIRDHSQQGGPEKEASADHVADLIEDFAVKVLHEDERTYDSWL